jgi:class 3 adenylate cyclase
MVVDHRRHERPYARGVTTRRVAIRRSSRLRPAVWALHLSLPALGLWLLIVEPGADVRWEHHHAHFGLVLTTALIAAGVGAVIAAAAHRHNDPRIFLVACAFIASAGFFAVHALTTPSVFSEVLNLGWTASSTVGLLIASVLAALSALNLHRSATAWPLRHAAVILGALGAALGLWLLFSLARIPPFDHTVLQDEARGELIVVAAFACALFAAATIRYWLLYRRRPAVVLISVLTAWALLAEAAAATAIGRPWQLSWWLWHVLLVLAFGFVAYTADVQYRREGEAGTLFRGVAVDETVQAVRAAHEYALEQLVAVMREQQPDAREVTRLTAAVAQQFDLTEAQQEVLERAALSLTRERATTEQLAGLVELSQSMTVLDDEAVLLQRAAEELPARFGRDRMSLAVLHEGRLDPIGTVPPPSLATEAVERRAVVERERALAAPLLVKGEVAGVVAFERDHGNFDAADRAMVGSVAAQLGVQLENTRLYMTIDSLFRRYLAPTVVTRLLADPDQAALGGAVVEVTAFFADLRGFTTYSERHAPEEVVTLLNRYYAAIVPQLLAFEGTVVSYAGDAVMAVFNAPTRQVDHAVRAGRAALAIRDAVMALAGDDPELPTFGIGINTGPALVGNIGAELRDYTVIGDTVNVAARLEGAAAPGEVLIGTETRNQLGDQAIVEDAGMLELKGKSEPIPAWRLVSLTPS